MPTYQERLAEMRKQRTRGILPPVAPSPTTNVPGVPPGLELQGLTIGRGSPTMRFAPPKPPPVDQEQRLLVKRQSEVKTQMANLQRAMGKIESLFSEAETSLPAIKETGPTLRVEQGKRVIQNLAGNRESPLGFQDTFFVEARKQLKELEKGGRFTDQDIEQMLKSITPRDLESNDRRLSKKTRLLRSFQDEYDQYANELKSLGGTTPEDEENDPLGLR